ncbi:MAG TPA: hypothetical protein VNL13_02385 [Sulfolobales archaeon]|nr:hypothetical protein [Sulfolobales archaeon]
MKLIEEIASEIDGKLEKDLEEVEKNIRQLANDAISRKASELRARIDDAIKKYRSSIESSRSKIEVDLRKIIERRKEEWINKVIDDLKERFVKEFVSDKRLYREFLEESLKRILSIENKISIETNRHTASIIEEIVNELKVSDRVKITGRDLRISGGFIAISSDKAVRYNYSLEHVIESNMYELKVRVAKILFG